MNKKQATMGTPNTLHRSTVFLVNFVVRFIRLGLTKAYGVLIPYLAIQLDASNAVTGFLVTLHNASGFLCAPLANYLIQRFNYQRVVILTTFMSSVALLGTAYFMTEWAIVLCMSLSGCCVSPLLQLSVLALRKHFGDQFGSAFSASYTGSVFGTTLLPCVAIWCFNAYGLRGALLCINGLCLNIIIVGLLISLSSFSGNGLNSCDKQSQSENGQKSTPHGVETYDVETSCSINNDGDSDDTFESTSTIHLLPLSHTSTQPKANVTTEEKHKNCDRHVKKHYSKGITKMPLVVERCSQISTKVLDFIRVMSMYETFRNEPAVFLIVLPCRFFFDIIFLGWLVFMVSYALSVGINNSQAVYLPVSASIGGFCGRLFQGLILHKRPRWSSFLFVTNTIFSSVSIYGHTFSSSLWNLLLCSLLAGFSLFSVASVYFSMLADLVSEENFSEALAASFFVTGAGVLLSGFSVGLVYDLTHSLVVTFEILAGALAVISVIMSMFLFARRDRDKRGNKNQE